jgi:hypothetical protein
MIRLGDCVPAVHERSNVTTITDRNAADDAVEAAIARVLDAERASRLAVGAVETEAAAAVEAARACARAIALRAEARIRAVRAAFERSAAREVAALDATAAEAAGAHALDGDDEARLAAATNALAARLTGGT